MSGWRVVAASVAGTSHVRTGLPCQDAHAWLALPGGGLAIAVADGAGSALHAQHGAAAAAHGAVEALAASDGAGPAQAVEAALAAALAAVEARATALGATPGELATTLIVARVDAGGGAAAQVGDGALVLDDGAGPRAATVPVSGEFANETFFLTTPGAVEAAQRVRWSGPRTRVAAFTDGLQGLALQRPGSSPHVPFFAPLFNFAAGATDPDAASAELGAFLAGPRVASRSDDDLTLVLAARG